MINYYLPIFNGINDDFCRIFGFVSVKRRIHTAAAVTVAVLSLIINHIQHNSVYFIDWYSDFFVICVHNILFNKFKIISIDPRIALPRTLAANLVNQRGVGLTRRVKGIIPFVFAASKIKRTRFFVWKIAFL